MTESKTIDEFVPAYLSNENIKELNSEDILDEFEKWTNLCHYDPHGQSGHFNPFTVAERLRREVLHRMQTMPTEVDDL